MDEHQEIWKPNKLRCFISHKSESKGKAIELKIILGYLGVDSFVAHEDINPSKKWRDTILNALTTMDVFVALVTPRFADSEWTDQEVGFALGSNKPIISIAMSAKLHGFLEGHQAIKRKRGQTIKDISLKIVKSVINDSDLGLKMKDMFVNSFKESKSFEETKIKIEVLENIGEITKRQAKKLWRAYHMNDQIWNYGGAWRMKGYFKDFEKK